MLSIGAFGGPSYAGKAKGEVMSETRREIMKLLADFGTIGMTVAFCIFIGVWIGHYLDHKVFDGRTAPWLTLLFLGFGIAAAFKNLLFYIRRGMQEGRKENNGS